ncbi:MAG: BamA/TamA family outer membrane protein [Gammaproteobacteria bacterium]|nr:BamA/TamA family outer membrane protein [Gammaproteobacteria bacterium]
MTKWQLATGALLLLLSSSSIAATLNFTSQIEGLKGDALKNAQKRLQLNQNVEQKNLTAQLIRHYYRQGDKQIKTAIAPYGYFNPTIKRSLHHNNGHWLATYLVTPGTPLRVTQLHLEVNGAGKNNPQLTELLKTVPLKQGEVFTSKRYENTSEALLILARRLGYIHAKLSKNRITIDRHAYTCIIEIVLDSGARYYFGHVTFSPSPLSAKLLNRYLNFNPGEIYSETRLINLQHQLSSSGYFSEVEVIPQLDKSTNQHIPVKIDLEKNHRKAYELGAGYGTGTGPRATIGVNWRWVNRYGHKFKAQAQLSEVSNSFSAQYIIPGKQPTRNQYALTASSFYITPQDSQSNGQRFSAGYLTQQGYWKNIYQLVYLHERFRFDDNEPHQSSYALIPTLTFRRTRMDKPLNPSHGSDFTLMLHAASRATYSSFDFAQSNIKYAHLFSLTRYTRFLLRGEWGYTTVHERKDLPLSLNYYAGGPHSIRGYDSYKFGPGRYLLLGTAELRQRLFGNLWAAIFIDQGNAFDDLDEGTNQGIGSGLIWHSPVGPIAVSAAWHHNYRDNRFVSSRQPEIQFTVGML